MGKAPYTVAKLGKKHGKKTVAVCGIIENSSGLSRIFDLCIQTKDENMSVEMAMKKENAVLSAKRAGQALVKKLSVN